MFQQETSLILNRESRGETPMKRSMTVEVFSWNFAQFGRPFACNLSITYYGVTFVYTTSLLYFQNNHRTQKNNGGQQI